MGKRWKTALIPVNELITEHLPIYEPFMTAWLDYVTGERNPEPLTVCAGKVKAPPLAPIQAAFVAMADYDSFNELRRQREELLSLVPVLERADGSLWAYDDGAYITLFHRFAPASDVRVVVIGHDPAADDAA